MKTKVIYVPLDERACNYYFPQKLAAITKDIDLLVPDRKLMGFKKTPADFKAIWEWIFSIAKDCDYAILSVDTLVYGNIINSRIHKFDIPTCEKTINNFRKLKQINPNIEIHAFNLAARVAGYNGSNEDPDYWATHGRDIWRYTCLTDKNSRAQADEAEVKEMNELKASIPEEYLKDFLFRRDVDRFTNLTCVDLVGEGIFEQLTVPKDDTAEYGYAALDQIAIRKKVVEKRLMNKVFVYPGADEVGSIIFTRVFNKIKNYTPRVYLRYSSTLGPTIIPRYEDRPVNESIKSQVTSLGGIVEDNATNSDCMLALNTAGKYQIESGDQANKDLTFSSHINMDEFFRYINYYSKAYNKAIGMAEISVCNGCENECMDYALLMGVYDNIEAVGGWNTSENTIGVVLAQTVIASYYNRFENDAERKELNENFKITRLTEDWLFQANILPQFLREYYEKINPYFLGKDFDFTVKYFTDNLNKIISEKFPEGYKGRKYTVKDVYFDWDGVFFIRFGVVFDK